MAVHFPCSAHVAPEVTNVDIIGSKSATYGNGRGAVRLRCGHDKDARDLL